MNDEERADLLDLVERAVAEDVGAGDLTSQALVPVEAEARGRIVVKAAGVLAGLEAARAVFARVDPALDIRVLARDGDSLSPGAAAAEVSGSARSLLAAERAVLNFLQRLSGVATLTRAYVEAVAGTAARIFDTRKTLPAFRRLDKYAVRIGGGCNHRMGLYDQVLIKENHLRASGCGPGEGVRRARASAPPGTVIEVEVEDLDQFQDALGGAPDVIMLDDMGSEDIRRAVGLRGPSGGPVLEVSGGVTLATARAVAELGVDRISVGALTHSAPALDIAMKFA